MDLQRGGRAVLTLDAGHVDELAREIAPFVEGRSVRAVVALVPRDLVLVLDDDTGPGPRLRLSADPDGPRFHLSKARAPRGAGPVGPFFRRVEEELTGARLARLEPLARDRVLKLTFEGGPTGQARSLILELFGRRANLLLCGGGERLLDVLDAPPADAKVQRLVLGSPWQPPGGRAAAAAGPSLAERVRAEAGAGADPPATPLSDWVETHLSGAVAEVARARARRDLEERLRRRLERARGLASGLEARARASQEAESVRAQGDWLNAHRAQLARGLSGIDVDDPLQAGGVARIELDPRRSPGENVEALFERYRKLVRAQATVAGEWALALEKARALEDLMSRLQAPESDPAVIEAEALAGGWLEEKQQADARKRKAPEPRLPYRVFQGVAGAEIRVGRNAKDNDELTLRHSRGNDLWLHTADAPGSHVVLRLERNAQADPEDVLDAAHLAVHFSPLREAAAANVHVARRKEVHKPRGAKPGLVTLAGGRVMRVRMQPERLSRLLGRDERQAARERS